MLTNKKGPEGRALILLFIFNPRFCDYLHSARGGVKYPKAELVQNPALSGTNFLLKKSNKNKAPPPTLVHCNTRLSVGTKVRQVTGGDGYRRSGPLGPNR